MDSNDYIISFSFVETLIGTKLSKILRNDLEDIMHNKNVYDKYSINRYNKALTHYLSYFDFNVLKSNNIIFTEKCDLILEKSQIIRDLDLTKDEVIAFLRCGVVVLPKRLYIYCKPLDIDDYKNDEL